MSGVKITKCRYVFLFDLHRPGIIARRYSFQSFSSWLTSFRVAQTVKFLGSGTNSTKLVIEDRYLESSGCVGMCVNMCKIPTQDFFTNEFGLPLTMTPSTITLHVPCLLNPKPHPESHENPCIFSSIFVYKQVNATTCLYITILESTILHEHVTYLST